MITTYGVASSLVWKIKTGYPWHTMATAGIVEVYSILEM
jgi:hypothetical protein